MEYSVKRREFSTSLTADEFATAFEAFLHEITADGYQFLSMMERHSALPYRQAPRFGGAVGQLGSMALGVGVRNYYTT